MPLIQTPFARPSNRRQRGIALIMVLMVVVVLGILAGGFAYSMKVETKLARNASWDTDMEWLGRAGIETAKYCLSQRSAQGGGIDHLGQAWAGGRQETNETVARLLGNWIPLGNGEFKVTLEDLDRKMNINSADETILRQALSIIGVDASQTPVIVNSILDWRDPDNDPRPSGAESDIYERQNPPYVAKNGRIDDLSELLLIQGISPNMYWGSGAGGQAYKRPRSARDSQFDEPVYSVGFKDLFTANSGGRLNINTASAQTLQLFPFIDEIAASAIIARRAGPDGQDGTEDDMPYRGVQDIGTLPGLHPGMLAQYSQLLSTVSFVFEVKVEARVGKQTRTYTAYLRRSGSGFQTLNLLWN